jgi:NADPH-dependent glutamate synthase beta subunit-like oxidoreductase
VDRKAVYKPYAQAIPGAFAIEKIDTAPCRVACPANLNVQGYVAMVKMGKYREAVEIIMQDLPFPGILVPIVVKKAAGALNWTRRFPYGN